MQSLMQTALDGQLRTQPRAGSETGQGQAGLVSAAAPRCKPGWLHSLLAQANAQETSTTPCSCWAVGKAKKPLSLAVLWKPRNVHPGDSELTTTKTLLSSVEYCCIALVIVQQRKEKSWKKKKAVAGKIFLTKKDKDECFSYLCQAFLCEI